MGNLDRSFPSQAKRKQSVHDAYFWNINQIEGKNQVKSINKTTQRKKFKNKRKNIGTIKTRLTMNEDENVKKKKKKKRIKIEAINSEYVKTSKKYDQMKDAISAIQ